MNEYKSLKSPPIREAQISVNFQKEESLDAIEKSISKLEGIYVKKEKYYTFTQTLQFGDQKLAQVPTEQKQIGFRMLNDANSEGMVISTNSIVFSLVENYSGWSKFTKRFYQVIDTLKAEGLDPSLRQVGLRFINRLLFKPNDDIAKYLKILPSIPESKYSSSAENLVIRYNMTESKGAKSAVQLLYKGLTATSDLEFIFDVSTFLYKNPGIKVDTLSDDLEYLRGYKNDIFFNAITPELIKRYDV